MSWISFRLSDEAKTYNVCKACGNAYASWGEAMDCCSGSKLARVYVCPRCDKVHDDNDNAEICCEELRSEQTAAWLCPKCGDPHETRGDALECCQTRRDVASGPIEPRQGNAWKCPECERLFNDESSASECCGNDKTYLAYQCLICDKLSDNWSGAKMCCEDEKVFEDERYVCPECGRAFVDRVDAEECCSEERDNPPSPPKEKWSVTFESHPRSEDVGMLVLGVRRGWRKSGKAITRLQDLPENVSVFLGAHEVDGRLYTLPTSLEEIESVLQQQGFRIAGKGDRRTLFFDVDSPKVDPVVVDLDVASSYGLSSLYHEARADAEAAWAKHRNLVLRWASKKDLASAEIVRTPDAIEVTARVWCDSGDDLIDDAIPEGAIEPSLRGLVIERVRNSDALLDLQIDDPDFSSSRGLLAESTLEEALDEVENAFADAESENNDNFERLVEIVSEATASVVAEYESKLKSERERAAFKTPPRLGMGEGWTAENPSIPRDVGEVWEDDDFVTGGRCWYVQFPTYRDSYKSKSLAKRWSAQLKKDLSEGNLELDMKMWTPEGVNRRKPGAVPIMLTMGQGLVVENPAVTRPLVEDDAETTDLFWDCECDSDYIHYKGQRGSSRYSKDCAACGAHKDSQPDSIVSEVVEHLRTKDPALLEWLMEVEEEFKPWKARLHWGVRGLVPNPKKCKRCKSGPSEMRRRRVTAGVRSVAQGVAAELGFGLHPAGGRLAIYAEPWHRWNLEALDLTFDEEREVVYHKINLYVRENTIPELEARGYRAVGYWQDDLGDGVAFGWTLVALVEAG